MHKLLLRDGEMYECIENPKLELDHCHVKRVHF